MLPNPVDFGGNWPTTRELDQRPVRRWLLFHQGADEAQKGLVLWVQRTTAEKCADVDLGYLTAGATARS